MCGVPKLNKLNTLSKVSYVQIFIKNRPTHTSTIPNILGKVLYGILITQWETNMKIFSKEKPTLNPPLLGAAVNANNCDLFTFFTIKPYLTKELSATKVKQIQSKNF